MSDTKKNILGCFVSVTHPFPEASHELKMLTSEQGKLFRSYIWGDEGVDSKIKQLKSTDYGGDLKFVLFQFYVNPMEIEKESLEEIESYRKREKSVGIPIIVDQENFFNKDEKGRYAFLKNAVLGKMDLLEEVVKKRKLDTDIVSLKKDLAKVLDSYP